MSDVLQVELVSADRLVWSGEAKQVIARTTNGDIGILPHHAPLLAVLVHGVVDVTTTDNESWVAAVDSGFLSVAKNRISILSENAELAHDIDLEAARRDLERAQELNLDEGNAAERVRSAQARIRAAERVQ